MDHQNENDHDHHHGHAWPTMTNGEPTAWEIESRRRQNPGNAAKL